MATSLTVHRPIGDFLLDRGADQMAHPGGTRYEHMVGVVFRQLVAVAADCFTRAIVRAVLSAASATTPAGHWPADLDVFGSAGRR